MVVHHVQRIWFVFRTTQRLSTSNVEGVEPFDITFFLNENVKILLKSNIKLRVFAKCSLDVQPQTWYSVNVVSIPIRLPAVDLCIRSLRMRLSQSTHASTTVYACVYNTLACVYQNLRMRLPIACVYPLSTH